MGLDAPFLATDTHWTVEGARAVAAAVAADTQVAALAPSETAYVAEPEAAKTFAGDLVSYVTSDALAPHVGLAPETVTPYRAVAAVEGDGAAAVLDLFGDTGGDAADLVGTSYSANPDWSFAEALKIEMARDVINHATEGQGPFAPMAAYLDRLDPAAPPALVLWEIPVRYLTDPEAVGEGGA